MKTISVATGRPYNILIERGLIKSCGEEIRKVSRAKRVMIISDSNVFPIYGETVVNSLKDKVIDTLSHNSHCCIPFLETKN